MKRKNSLPRREKSPYRAEKNCLPCGGKFTLPSTEQKGEIEKNHEYIRYVLPQGTSFDAMTQEKVDLLMSHINSTARPSLQGRSPIELALQHFGKDTVEKLGLRVIRADDVCLKPELLK